MKALTFSSEDGLRLEVREDPKEQNSEAIVKIRLAGICSTVRSYCLTIALAIEMTSDTQEHSLLYV
jgi:threonine dehydrogenase-like Zn-dependent dehydrogenase